MRPAAVAQADYLLSPQEVEFLWHDGAQAVSCAEAAAAVQADHKHLGENNTHTRFPLWIYLLNIFYFNHIKCQKIVKKYTHRQIKHQLNIRLERGRTH